MFVYLFLRSWQSCNLSSKHRRRILACPFLSRLQHSHIFASRIIFFLLFSNVPFSLLFPILLSASGCPCGMGEDVLYFDRSSGKRKVKPYQSLTENSKANTQWFDPSTGRLCAMQANPSMVPVSMNHKQGFFGGAHSSSLTETRGQSCSSKEFEDKVKSKRRHGEGPNYSPTKIGRSVTGLKYCGRYFGVQSPGHDGNCGPTNGPNCPACRVLKSERVEKLRRRGKLQGWTGEVYCGRYFGIQSEGHDGYCGPNNGPSCPECYNELLHS